MEFGGNKTVRCTLPKKALTKKLMKEKTMKKLTKAIALAGVMATGLSAAAFSQAEEVEVSASAAVSNMYLWRGLDLGNGAAAVSGTDTS